MRVIFLGKKPAAAEALRYLVERGAEVAVVVAPPDERELFWSPKLTEVAEHYGIPIASAEELYQYLENPQKAPRSELEGCIHDIDLVISFLFWKKIQKPLIVLPKIGCINFHPAPLPEFRGVGGYNVAILENKTEWGVSAHFIDETIDTGPIIATRRFAIDPALETAFSLEQKSQAHLLGLFRDVIDDVRAGRAPERIPQGEGRYIAKSDFEEMRKILPTDSEETIRRKIRAFWYPPYGGAAVTFGGSEFTVIDGSILKDIAGPYHKDAGFLQDGSWLDEEAYRESINTLTLKYLDILVVKQAPEGGEKFLLGRRKEKPAQNMLWLCGGRSKHFMPYTERVIELVQEDFGFRPDPRNVSFIGSARLHFSDARFSEGARSATTDGDISLYAVQIDETSTIKTGKCFSEVKLVPEAEARRENPYVNFAITCYRYHKEHGTAFSGEPRVFDFRH